MAKKKTIDIKTVTADVPSGDVNISYKNTRIAGLSESTTAVLETKDTICEDDIEVEYTKTGGSALNTASIAVTTNAFIDAYTIEAVNEVEITGGTVLGLKNFTTSPVTAVYTSGEYIPMIINTEISAEDVRARIKIGDVTLQMTNVGGIYVYLIPVGTQSMTIEGYMAE